MKFFGKFLFYSIKREISHISFWILLGSFLLGVFYLQKTTSDPIPLISIGIIWEEDSASFLDNLNQANSIFTFLPYESIDTLKQEVRSGQLECGYYFPNDFFDNIRSGKRHEIATLFVSSETTLALAANETIYSILFESFSLLLLQDDLQTDPLLSPLPTIEESRQLYQTYLSNDSTFSFQYEGMDALPNQVAKPSDAITLASLLKAPIRGVSSLFLLLVGLCGSLAFSNDKSRKCYAQFPAKKQLLLSYIRISYPIVIALPTILMTYFLSGLLKNPLKELCALFLYGSCLSIYCLLFHLLFRHKIWQTTALLCLISMSLLVTPILFDFSILFPWIKQIGQWFPTYHYLKLF